MPQNSSTSSSEPGRRASGALAALRYLGTAAAAGLLLTAAVVALNIVSARNNLAGTRDQSLLHRQLTKIEQAPRIDVALVGDSSLGNAVEAAQWSERTGRAVANLALTGRYGYVGSRNMILRVLRRHRPQMIVMVQTLDMATREPSATGDVLTAARWEDVELQRPGELFEQLGSLDPVLELADAVLGVAGVDFDALDRLDYVAQRTDPRPAELLAKQEKLEIGDISEEKLAVLAEIGDLCRERGIPCLYAHGPLLDPFCSRSAGFTAVVNREIAARGFTVVSGTPLCVGADEIGDSIDHVRDSVKGEVSARYLGLVLDAAGGLPAAAPAVARKPLKGAPRVN